MWLEQCEGRGEGRCEGRLCKAFWAAGRTWAFTRRGGCPGRWAEEERNLTQVLTGTLWWLFQGRQATGGRGQVLGDQGRSDSVGPGG